MKQLFFFLAILIAAGARGQDTLPIVHLSENLTVHFISPEPIQYVDISGKDISGDLPLKNVLRIKLKDTVRLFSQAVVTIAGEKFIAQFRVVKGGAGFPLTVDIMPQDCRPLDIAEIGLSQNQLKALSLDLIAQKPAPRVEVISAFGLKAQLNHVYTLGDYIFLDISCKNKTRICYATDEFRFRVEDKKVISAANSQAAEFRPVFELYPAAEFEKYYRNIFVFKKMTFPGDKVFLAELSEKQFSGRVITLRISYRDILRADTLPN
jgi:conjugative transposon TraN protein